ncbi:nucleotide-sugar uncharacterized transporter 3 [Senna tora]|uniref:Nucleotide-sugar uncharacterized transporter 3 n=1 Tax=Senna tora TaxID=362788 RepID=A0A834U1K3_9FABA|nr:nucleotide-sugar uncharacterized transporter 3 [Senna tora]
MSLKPSDSSENLILPVSDTPKDQDGKTNFKLDDKLFKGSAMTKRGAYAAISYMSCAVLLVMFNKAALSSYNFPSANVITLLQLATMESVRGVNVPMYTTLRRTTVVFTMLVEYILVGQSVGLIVLGAFIAGARDLSFDAYGYAIVFMSNITTAIYLATIARIGKTSGLNSFGLMWCNNSDIKGKEEERPKQLLSQLTARETVYREPNCHLRNHLHFKDEANSLFKRNLPDRSSATVSKAEP